MNNDFEKIWGNFITEFTGHKISKSIAEYFYNQGQKNMFEKIKKQIQDTLK